MLAKYSAVAIAALAGMVAIARWAGQIETRITLLEQTNRYFHGESHAPQ